MYNPNANSQETGRAMIVGPTGPSTAPSGFNAGPFSGGSSSHGMTFNQARPQPTNQPQPPYNNAGGGNPVNLCFSGHEHVDIHVYTGNTYYMMPPGAAAATQPSGFPSTGFTSTAAQTSQIFANPGRASASTAPVNRSSGEDQWSFIQELIGQQEERNASQTLAAGQNPGCFHTTANESLPQGPSAAALVSTNGQRSRGPPHNETM